MNQVIQIWCEWDIGQQYVVFTNEETAVEWAEAQLVKMYEDDEDDYSWEALEADGLIGFNFLKVI